MKNKRLIIILLIASLLLLIPIVAMLFTDEVNWTASDFAIAGALLIGAGLSCELVLKNVKKINHRIAICGVLLIVLVLIWAELAVGIFGTSLSGQ